MNKNPVKHMDVDVIAFLEEKMKSNTKHYQGDFDYDKELFERFVNSPYKEDKSLLWLSRTHGTQCQRESEVFIKDTAAHNTWMYYADSHESIVACAVELSGVKDGIVLGNVYELDYAAHTALVATKSVEPLESIKTFEDGFTLNVPFGKGSYGYYLGFVEEHGAIVRSLDLPKDKELHQLVLAEQKASRDKMKAARQTKAKPSLADQIKSASTKAGSISPSSTKTKESEREQ